MRQGLRWSRLKPDCSERLISASVAIGYGLVPLVLVSSWVPAVWIALGGVVLASYHSGTARQTVNGVFGLIRKPSIRSVIITGVSAFIFLLPLLFLTAWHPLASWDAISGEWGRLSYSEGAIQILESLDSEKGYVYEGRHSPVNEVMLALPHLTGQHSGSASIKGVLTYGFVAIIPPILFMVLLIAIHVDTARKGFLNANVTKSERIDSLLLVAVGVIILLSSPLLSNHLVLIGYLDIHITVLTLAAVVSGTIAIYRRKLPTAMIYCLTVLPLVKGAGITIACSIGLSYLITVISGKWRLKLLFAVLATIFTLLLIPWHFSFESEFTNKVGIDMSQRIVWLSGRELYLSSAPVKEMLMNIFISVFNNATFSVTLVFLLIGGVAATLNRQCEDIHSHRAKVFLVCVSIGVLTIALGLQFTTYGFGISEADTGLSRFLLPISGVSTLLAIDMVTDLCFKNNRTSPSPSRV